jgi:hypothetical protein
MQKEKRNIFCKKNGKSLDNKYKNSILNKHLFIIRSMVQNFVSRSNIPIDITKGAAWIQWAHDAVRWNTDAVLWKTTSVFMENPQDAYYLRLSWQRVPDKQQVNSTTSVALHPSEKTLEGYVILDRTGLIVEFDRLAAINKTYSEYLLKQSGDAGSSKFLANTTILSMLTLEARMQAIEDILRSRQS